MHLSVHPFTHPPVHQASGGSLLFSSHCDERSAASRGTRKHLCLSRSCNLLAGVCQPVWWANSICYLFLRIETMHWSKPHPHVTLPEAAFSSQQQHWARKDTAICSSDFKKSLLAPEVTWGAGNSEPGAYVNSWKGENPTTLFCWAQLWVPECALECLEFPSRQFPGRCLALCGSCKRGLVLFSSFAEGPVQTGRLCSVVC